MPCPFPCDALHVAQRLLPACLPKDATLHWELTVEWPPLQMQAATAARSEWGSFYVDYSALKQILSQLTRDDIDAQSEGNAQVREPACVSAECPLSTPATASGRLTPRSVRSAARRALAVVAAPADPEGEQLLRRKIRRAQRAL